jgi:thiamine biosynthesis lipoprotein
MTVAASVAVPPEGELERFAFRQMHMGVPFDVLLYAPDADTASAAAEAASERIEALNAILSDYDPDSELTRLSATAGQGRAVPIGDDLLTVLLAAQDLSRQTDGAFDVTVGPLTRLWRRARRTRQMPNTEQLQAGLEAVGYCHLRLDPAHRTVELLCPKMRLDLGGIAMGYAVDEALKVLAEQGIRRAMIDASGDIGLGDPPPERDGWRIGIAPLEPEGPPSRYVMLANAAITTSGDAFQYLEIDGRRYSHIVHPKTGLGLTDHSSVTVIAADCMAADSLATAVSVLGPEKGLALIEAVPDAWALIVRKPDEEVEVHESRRLDTLRIEPAE